MWHYRNEGKGNKINTLERSEITIKKYLYSEWDSIITKKNLQSLL